MAGKHELVQGLSLPGRQVSLLQGLWQFGRVGFVSNGQGRPCLGMLRYLVNLPRHVGKYADHLMYREASSRCLHHQIPGGKAQVVNGSPIVLLVLGKLQTDDAQDQYRYGPGPSLIRFHETGEESSKFRSVFPACNQIAPRLFVV